MNKPFIHTIELENSTIEVKVTDKNSNEVERLKQALKGANDEIKELKEEVKQELGDQIQIIGNVVRSETPTGEDLYVYTDMEITVNNKEFSAYSNKDGFHIDEKVFVSIIKEANSLLRKCKSEDLSIIDMAKKIKEYCNERTCNMCKFDNTDCKLNKDEPQRWDI